MFTLAMRSVRQRPGRLVATMLSAFVGAAIIMTFSSLLDTAAAPGVDEVSSTSLSVSASVVGGYGSLLVFFAIASTLTVNVRQRGEEIHLLRCTGATPAQIKRMVLGEAAVVGLVGAALAIGPAVLGGRALVSLFKDSGQVAADVDHVFGTLALASGFGVAFLASVGAAFLAVRRATKAAAGVRKIRGRRRTPVGIAALVAGTVAVFSTFAVDSTFEMLMAFPVVGALLLSVGFAVLAPSLLGNLLGRVERPLARLAGASGYLAVRNLRQRSAELAGVLMPMILFTGIATATLYMQAVETDWVTASGLSKTVDDKNLETLNLVVVGIIVVFSCIMLINSLYAATSYRSREFGQQRLAGSTPGQVMGTVGCEAVLFTATGLFFGTVAGVAGFIPFTMVRADRALPEQGFGIWLGILAVAAAATMITTLATARRSLRTAAIDAVAIAA